MISDRDALTLVVAELRPRLHKYCARLVGSVIDGEDAVQEAIVRAFAAFDRSAPIDNPEGWLFRIAHNASLDQLRRNVRDRGAPPPLEDSVPDPSEALDARIAAAASLQTFMRLPVSQRSSVLLADVLGHSLDEIATITSATVPAVKASLHRGRTRLRELSTEPAETRIPTLSDAERARLITYVDRFNAGDFDAVRALLAEDVHLDLVARKTMNGKREVSTYVNNYSGVQDWRFAPGFVDGVPAVLVYDPRAPERGPVYFVLLGWSDEGLAHIRDFRYARYVIDGAELTPLLRP